MSMNISSNFFNSMLGTSSSNSSSGLMGLLSDYNSIRNGSYLKLAKHYYSNDSAKKATQKQFSKSNIETKTEDTATKTASEDAWKDLKTLKDEKLYQSADTDKHPLFAGLPVNGALNWPYQSVVKNGDQRFGFRMQGEELVVGSYRSTPFELGTAVGIIPCGKGKIIFSSLDIADNLDDSSGPAEVAKKILCNYIKYSFHENIF